MKTIIRSVLAATAIVFSVAHLRAGDPLCISYFDSIAKEAAPIVGEQYYMRHCLKYEGAKWPTSNYWVGTLVPINSKVTLTYLGAVTMQIRVEKTNQVITIENNEKYTQKDMITIAKNMLTREPVPIDKFDEKTVKNISSGNLSLGMTKEQVVMTRGYPPAHQTPTLESDRWTYWRNRFITRSLGFQDSVLIKGRGTQ